MNNFNVYVIHSPKPLTELKQLLQSCGGFNYAKIIYRSVAAPKGSRKEETKKTLVFCPESTVQSLKSKYPEYQAAVTDYKWDSFPVPNQEMGESWDFHISGVPNDFTVKDAEKFVTDALSCVICEKNESDLINYKVSFTPRSRETGEINGYGFISFGKHVPEVTIRLCKLVLHNTPILFKKTQFGKRMVTCTWHREPGSRERRPIRVLKNPEPSERFRPALRVDLSNIQPEVIPMTSTI